MLYHEQEHLTYSDFYDIAVYANVNWKGSFTPKEVACNAFDYLSEWEWSVKYGKATEIIRTLHSNLVEDIENGCDDENVKHWLGQMERKFGFGKK